MSAQEADGNGGRRVETVRRLALSERIKLAVAEVLEHHAAEIDTDHAIRAVRLEVRIRPDRDVRAVIFDKQSEYADR